MSERTAAIAGRAAVTGRAVAALARSGLLAPIAPRKLPRVVTELSRRGPVGAACSLAAIRWEDAPALTDELGTLSFIELDRRSNAIARAWAADGVGAGDGVAILCRNHRGFLDAYFAAAKLGLRCVYMNTEFAPPQVDDVCRREGIRTVVADEELADRVPAWTERRFTAWSDGGDAAGADATLEELIASSSGEPLPPPAEHPTMVMLTSGTTGTPKGAPRQEAGTIGAVGALLERVPFRAGECMYVAPPFFHALGFATLTLGISLGCRVVTRRRFEPREFLDGLERERVAAAVVVPAMLQRTFELGDEQVHARDTSALRIVFCAGSQLPGPTATRTLELFGDVLYVLYGSTEVAYASISTPADHRIAPTTVGRICLGARVKLLDERGREVPAGETGRIFVSNGTEFSGYTDGRSKEVIDGLMSSGDVGHLDARGLLYIDGRDDEMIVSGGENVFPQEVEELLAAHPAVADAAVVGVPDADFGQRLAAYVVAAGDTEPTAAELKEYVRENLARYKVPRDVHFLGELPRNATGKVLKRELARAAA